MSDLLETGAVWLETQRTKYVTRRVVYRRGAEAVELPATIGRTVFRLDKGYGLAERIESRDYLVLVVDLVLGGAPILPKPGDQVRETEGGQVFIYEVMAPGNEPCWRYSDPFRRTYRIHSKLAATEAAP